MARTKTSPRPGATGSSSSSPLTPRATSSSPATTSLSKPNQGASRGDSGGGHSHAGIHNERAAAPLAPGQTTIDPQRCSAGSNPLAPGQSRGDTHSTIAGDFSLRAYAREFVADRTGDLRTLAAEFATSVPEDALRDVLTECAPDVLRRAIRENRAKNPRPQGTPWYARGDGKAKRVPLSHKLAAFIYPDPFNAGQTKYLRDFTAEDCTARASHLERHADDTMAEAAKFHRLASEVSTRGRKTVNGLREELVLSILEGDEA